MVAGIVLVLALILFWIGAQASDECAESRCPSGTRPRIVYKSGCLCVIEPEGRQ